MCTFDAFRPLLLNNVALRFNGSPHVYRCRPDWRWESGPLTDFDVWCVLEGTGTFHLKDGPLPLSAGVCLIIPPDCAPRAEHDPAHPLTVFASHFDAPGLEATRSKALVQRVRDVPFLTMLAERSDAAAQKAGYVALLQAESLVREVLLLIATEAETPADGGRDEEIEALLSDIRLMPERRWSIDAMAKQACLSRSQLSRRTERVSGMSPMEYVIRTRLERACRLLIETRQSVSEIAVSLGYDDAHYFSRQFTGRFGMSPSRYRTTGM